MEILRYTAFSSDPAGGNPAGVVLDATGAVAAEMLAVAADVGYSETAFLVPRAPSTFDVRYFSPLAEVSFCGHATIAAAVAHAERHGSGRLRFDTPAGPIDVDTHESQGRFTATLTSVAPSVAELPDALRAELLAALDWTPADLDPRLPARVAYAGAYHPIVAAATRQRLGDLHYDFERLGAFMAANDWTTVDLIWRESDSVFHARNAFPPGGVVEDPATGAAAAALGGYLRELDQVAVPARITVYQGADAGRPGVLTVDIPAAAGTGISVSGPAVPIG